MTRQDKMIKISFVIFRLRKMIQQEIRDTTQSMKKMMNKNELVDVPPYDIILNLRRISTTMVRNEYTANSK